MEPDDPRTRTVTLDGIEGVPFLVAMALGGTPGLPWRWPRYGKVEACGWVDYGPYGRLLTVLMEGSAIVWRPDEAPNKQIGMVPWRMLATVAATLGVQ